MIEFIAEWCQPRDLQTAMQQAEMAKSIGATWSKWQILDPRYLVSNDAKRYWAAELGGSESQLETFKNAGMSAKKWLELADCCRTLDVKFLATPFDLSAVDLLEGIGVEAYKIASGDINYRPLYERINRTGKRVFFSTGAASIAEIRSARSWLKHCAPVAMACDLVYPCPAHQADLIRRLPALLDVTSVVGYSDHTRELVTGAVAVAHGARVLEKHVTLDLGGGAPDDKMALTVNEAHEYLKLANDALALCLSVKGDPQLKARIGARRSAHATRSLESGHTLKAEDFAWLRPAPKGSIAPNSKLAGRVLLKPLIKGQCITRDVLA